LLYLRPELSCQAVARSAYPQRRPRFRVLTIGS
jgi:hypothetical protein